MAPDWSERDLLTLALGLVEAELRAQIDRAIVSEDDARFVDLVKALNMVQRHFAALESFSARSCRRYVGLIRRLRNR